MDLSDLEFAILDALYFVEPFDKIVEETGVSANIVGDEIKNLLAKRWVQVMTFDEKSGDFIRANVYDGDRLRQYYFLLTKEGLMKHNGAA